MSASAVARALTFLFVLIQSYFKWSEIDHSDTNIKTYLNEHQHLAGLILARGGSKGIPKKNISNLNGKPLIYWALQAMIDSGVFQTIWVSTDDKTISDLVRKEFSTVLVHSRAAYTATDKATSIIAVQEFLSFHPEIDAIGLVQATSPFVQPEYLREAYALLSKRDSVFSATKSKALRWTIANDATNEVTKPLNFDPKNRPRRQDWSGEMVENGMFYFTMRDVIINENVFQGTRSCYIQIPQEHALEIDSQRDLEIASFIMRNSKLFQIQNTTVQESYKIEL